MEGEVSKLSVQESDGYFDVRPRESQIRACASSHSSQVKNRKELADLVRFYTEKFHNQEVPRPDNWGGYFIQANYFEFWQGRPARLHDRVVVELENGSWKK